MQKLVEQLFWLDPSDPHRMALVMQVASRPLAHSHAAASGNDLPEDVDQKLVWAKAVHRAAAEGISRRAGARCRAPRKPHSAGLKAAAARLCPSAAIS